MCRKYSCTCEEYVGNIQAHLSYGGMCRKYSCTCVCECYGECAKIFLHRCVINIPAYIREWFGGEVKLLYRINAHSYIYNANVHCAIFFTVFVNLSKKEIKVENCG